MKKYVTFFLVIIISACTMKNEKPTEKHSSPQHESSMRSLGLIGGTSWHSTVEYYETINSAVNKHFGNNTNPPLLVYTLNQAEVHRFQKENKWDSIAHMLSDAAFKLKSGGAEAVLFCANTPHKVYDQVQKKFDLPIIHIGDATAEAIKNRNLKKVGFIGTRYTMTEDFITKRLSKNDIEVLVPEDTLVLEELQRIIEEELTYGTIVDKSKQYVMDVIQSMIDQGAEGIVLGCTEFPLMISQENFSIPVFNTSEIHSNAAVSYILSSQTKEETMIADVSCGQCQFDLKGQEGCDLAVRIDGKAYFVDGFHIDDFGDAHDKETGFCEVVRKAEVAGKIHNDRFIATSIKLFHIK